MRVMAFRVSGNAMSFSGPRAGPNQQSTVKNNIFAFARQSMINAYDPYVFSSVPPSPLFFVATGNIFYFDRNGSESTPFYVQGGCVYAGASTPYTSFQQFDSNLYWRTDGTFAIDPDAFHVDVKADKNNNCGGPSLWTRYPFAGWQGQGEDVGGLVKNPGFRNPVYTADDYSLPGGSPGVGFVPFDTCEAGIELDPAFHYPAQVESAPDPCRPGRMNSNLQPPAVPATFPTATFNPSTDF